jgi:hypothetical protein
MTAKIFSFKDEGVVLEPASEYLKLSKSFDRKAILEPLKESFARDNYKIDEASLITNLSMTSFISRGWLNNPLTKISQQFMFAVYWSFSRPRQFHSQMMSSSFPFVR